MLIGFVPLFCKFWEKIKSQEKRLVEFEPKVVKERKTSS